MVSLARCSMLTFRDQSLAALVLLLILSFSTVFNSPLGCLSLADKSKGLEEEEPQPQQTVLLSGTDRWKELNATTSSLTERSFSFHSSSRNKSDSAWYFERLRVVVTPTTRVPSKEWSEEDVAVWCPQPFSSFLESPKLVAAKDYSDPQTYPNSYATCDYRAVIEGLHEFATVSEEKTGELTLTVVKAQTIVKAAVCQFHPEWSVLSVHFPHAMQEVYVCIDYWIDTGAAAPHGTPNKTPVLLYSNTTLGNVMEKWKNNEFMKGILAVLREEMEVLVMTSEDYLACARFDKDKSTPPIRSTPDTAQQMETCDRVYHPDQTIRTSREVAQFFLFRKALEFNMYLKSFLKKQNRTQSLRPHKWRPLGDAFSSNSRRNGTDVCSRPPSIGILSREKSRGIVNADQLADDLSEFRYVYRQNDATNNRSTIGEFVARLPVEVIFFEHLSFVEQVEFFRRTDIVLSGHGAQLTGIPFMKTDEVTGHCKQVLELFPFDYVLPYDFGSLTVGSGMSHSYVYYDDSLRQESPDRTKDPNSHSALRPPVRARPLSTVYPWETKTGKTPEGRRTSRSSHFCPRRDDLVDYVTQLIFEWYRCQGC